MSHHIWTPAEDSKLLTLLACGYSRKALAKAIGRPVQHIGHRVSKLMPTGAIAWAKEHRKGAKF